MNVGIEGPSNTGKTTITATILERLAQKAVETPSTIAIEGDLFQRTKPETIASL